MDNWKMWRKLASVYHHQQITKASFIKLTEAVLSTIGHLQQFDSASPSIAQRVKGLCENGRLEEAMQHIQIMDQRALACLLQWCTNTKDCWKLAKCLKECLNETSSRGVP